MDRQSLSKTCPFKEGSTHKVTIQDLGEKGDGLARVEGFVVFVKGTKVGEILNIKIIRIEPRVAFGERV